MISSEVKMSKLTTSQYKALVYSSIDQILTKEMNNTYGSMSDQVQKNTSNILEKISSMMIEQSKERIENINAQIVKHQSIISNLGNEFSDTKITISSFIDKSKEHSISISNLETIFSKTKTSVSSSIDEWEKNNSLILKLKSDLASIEADISSFIEGICSNSSFISNLSSLIDGWTSNSFILKLKLDFDNAKPSFDNDIKICKKFNDKLQENLSDFLKQSEVKFQATLNEMEDWIEKAKEEIISEGNRATVFIETIKKEEELKFNDEIAKIKAAAIKEAELEAEKLAEYLLKLAIEKAETGVESYVTNKIHELEDAAKSDYNTAKIAIKEGFSEVEADISGVAINLGEDI